ncbi:MAG: FG-GAP repeat protein [Alphaproteobacteria bacterium]|nr:FG-GAP repeat protein [Alphaproteobacteria bacterium]
MTTYDLGSPVLSGATFYGPQYYTQLGRDLSALGDVNGDGINDFALQVTYTQNGYAPGGAYVLFGKVGGLGAVDLANLTAAQGFYLQAPGTYPAIVEHVAAAGDVNGDGFADFLISDPRYNDFTGRAYLVYGKASFAGPIDLANLQPADGRIFNGLVSSYSNGDWLGSSIAGIGDLNGDGLDDFFIGADTSSAYGTNSGRGWVIYGKVGGIGAVNLAAIAPADGFAIKGAAGMFAGTSASALGDVNGDGRDDFIVSGVFKTYVIYGKAGGYSQLDFASFPADAGFAIVGNGVTYPAAAAGDVNGDGYGDIVLKHGSGAAVVFGRAGGYVEVQLQSLAASDGFAVSAFNDIGDVAAAGDVNGDGFDDLLFGSIAYNNYAGKAFVLYGKAQLQGPVNLDTLADDAGVGFAGTIANGYAGLAVAAAGDVNADRIGDILIGAPSTGPLYNGTDYLIYGGLPSGSLTRVGAAGGQLIVGGESGDLLDGRGGDDELVGNGGADQLLGGEGNDRLDGGAGADALVGGVGNDTYVVDQAGDVVTELAGEGTDTVETSLGSRSDFAALYYLPDNVEYLTGTSGTGQGVWGSGADNVVRMGDGGDLVVLADRSDYYAAAAGNDDVDGGGGNDFLFFGGSFSNGDKVNGGAGFDTLGLLGTYSVTFDADDLVGIEKLAGYGSGNAAAPNNYAFTTIDANVASGQTLMVIGLSLRAGEHLVFDGSAENDGRFNLRGGWDSDTLTGGHGNDQIYGNLGADMLKGGGGNDSFEYYAVAESTAAARDSILDFSSGDRINLAALDADGNGANGDTAFTFIGSAAFTAAGQVRAVEDNSNPGHWTVEADLNGDGNADLSIAVTVVDGHAFAYTDFYL